MNGPSVGFQARIWIINLLSVAAIGFGMAGMDGLWRLMVGLQVLWVVYAIYRLWRSKRESKAEMYRMEEELVLYMTEMDRRLFRDRMTWDAEFRRIIRRYGESDDGH